MSRSNPTDSFLTQSPISITSSDNIDITDGHTLLGGALEDLYGHVIVDGILSRIGGLQDIHRQLAEAIPESLSNSAPRPVLPLGVVINLAAHVGALESWFQGAHRHLGIIQTSVHHLAGGLLPAEVVAPVSNVHAREQDSQPPPRSSAAGGGGEEPPDGRDNLTNIIDSCRRHAAKDYPDNPAADLLAQAIEALGGLPEKKLESPAPPPPEKRPAHTPEKKNAGYLGDILGNIGSRLDLLDHEMLSLEDATWARATNGATLSLQVQDLREQVKAGETPTVEEVAELLVLLTTVGNAAERIHDIADCIRGYSKELLPSLADLPRWRKPKADESAA